ncbi:hypothetical protein HCA67_08855 [Listeria booriae]|nr:hypothetical protein [Listeria booriae]
MSIDQATNFGDNVRSLNFGQPRLVADGFGDVGPSFIRNTNEAASNAGRVVRESASHLDDVPKIKEVPYGEHIIKGKGGRKELAPNTRYVTEDGYKYTTDELGRVVDVDAENLVLKTAELNEGMQRATGREYRLADDDGGHLIGSQFNGPGDIDNLVAQNKQINRSGGIWFGVAYGTLELSSAATGKDWMTGREMDAGERATRGAFALLDIIPGVKGLHAFSTATKAGGVALDAVQAGSKLTLKQTAKQGLSNLDAMGKQALRESAERIRNVPKVLKDTANTVKNTAQEGLTTVKKVTANNGMNFGRQRPSVEGMNVFENISTDTVKNMDNVIERVSPAASKVGKEVDDSVTYYRVQGGGEGNATSQHRISLNDDGTINITNHDSDLNLSAYSEEHATYFRDTKRPGGEIIEFKVPKALDDLLHETKVDQYRYTQNPKNQGGMAPKVVDPTTPGDSFEFPAPWVEWIEESAHSGRIIE